MKQAEHKTVMALLVWVCEHKGTLSHDQPHQSHPKNKGKPQACIKWYSFVSETSSRGFMVVPFSLISVRQ